MYRAQFRPHMEYCSHLWAGAPQYQLDPFDRIQRRVVQIVWDSMISTGLCVEMSPRCAFSIAFIMGSVLENCLTCFLPPNFLTAQYVTNSSIINTTWIRSILQTIVECYVSMCGFVETSFHAPRNCVYARVYLPGTVFPCWYNFGTLKKSVYLDLKGWQAPVDPLWLQGIVGGGIHLPSVTLICLVLSRNKKLDRGIFVLRHYVLHFLGDCVLSGGTICLLIKWNMS